VVSTDRQERVSHCETASGAQLQIHMQQKSFEGAGVHCVACCLHYAYWFQQYYHN